LKQIKREEGGMCEYHETEQKFVHFFVKNEAWSEIIL
jgi:hypothetical protein